MLHAADAGRRHVDLARIGLGIGDELGNGLGGHRRIHHHHGGDADDAGDRRDVADEIEIEIVVERGVDRVGLVDPEQRVAIGRRMHHRLGGDIGAGARAILDDELLAKALRQPLADQSRSNVGRCAGRKAADDAHRPRRIGLRERDPRDRWQRGSACCQMQKSSTGKFHSIAPLV